MTIYETIQKDKLKPGVNRALLSLIQGEICVDGKPMNDDAAIIRLGQMKKTCNKNIDIYQERNAIAQYDDEMEFLDMICNYLPAGAEKSDVENAIKDLNVERDIKSMGRIMGHLKKSFAIVDGNMVKSVLMEGQ